MNSTRSESWIFVDIYVVTTLFCLIVSIIISIGNFVVLFSFYKNPAKNLRSPSTLFFTNLIFSDFLTGVVVGSLSTADAYIDIFGENSVILDMCVFLFGGLLLFVNNLTITAVSFDRFIAVVKPLDYKSIMTSKRVKMIIALIWIFSFLICLLPVFRVPQWLLILIYSHSHATIPFLFLTTLYSVIFRSLKKQRRKVFDSNWGGSGVQTGIQQNARRKRLQQDHRLTVTIALVMILFCLSSLPFVISVHVLTYIQNCDDCLSEFSDKIIKSVIYFSSRCVLLNSALDPFLLTWRISRIRQAVRQTYACRTSSLRCTKQRSSVANGTCERTKCYST